MAKEFFKALNVTYEEYDVARDEQARNNMLQKSGQMAVPVIDIEGTIVVGFNKPQLSELLGIRENIR